VELKRSRYVHLLPGPDGVLAFNSLTLKAFRLTADENEILDGFMAPRNVEEPLAAVIQDFVDGRLLVAPGEDLPGTAMARLNLRRREGYRRGGGHYRTLRIALTERCNMACTYCFQQTLYPDDQPRMSPETLRETVRWFIDQAEGDHVTVQYFGGEPLMEWPLIVEAHGMLLQAQADGLIAGFRQTVTTNGTLVTPERARWMVERDFDLTFSFDGPPEQNDSQRVFKNGRGTYAKAAAGLRTFIEAGGQSAILMTATAENMTSLPETVRYFVEDSGLAPEVVGLNSPQPVVGGWETGGAELARVVFAIWSYCLAKGVDFHGPGTYLPAHLMTGKPQHDNCVDGHLFEEEDGVGAWPVYVSADGRKSRCLVHHRDLRVEITKGADAQKAGLDWHRGSDSIPDCDGCIASQMCGGPCSLERILWKGRLNEDRCGFMREMTRLVLTEQN
jgi:uncharacterized protein